MASRLLLVGCGKMGTALLEGWRDAGTLERAVVVEPGDIEVPGGAGIVRVADAADIPADLWPDTVVIAVKPQVMDAVLPAYAVFARPETVFLSIAAGKPVASLRAHLGDGARVVRAMPNTPAAIGKGVSVLFAGPGVDPTQQNRCDTLMKAAGTVEWIDDEGLMDVVTAVSGSGPAYVFHMIECLTEAGVANGLPDDLARRLAGRTVFGASCLAEDSGTPASTLRENVTSPGGTTAAALEVLMGSRDGSVQGGAQGGLRGLVAETVSAAIARSRALAE